VARHEGALRRLVRRAGAWLSTVGEVAGASWELPQDATLRLRPGRGGLAVRCRAGTLLVTQAGDPLDHVLSPGEEVTLGPRGLVVVWALSDAAIAAAGARVSNRSGRGRSSRAPSPPCRPFGATSPP
jgi:hypothetical protein